MHNTVRLKVNDCFPSVSNEAYDAVRLRFFAFSFELVSENTELVKWNVLNNFVPFNFQVEIQLHALELLGFEALEQSFDGPSNFSTFRTRLLHERLARFECKNKVFVLFEI